MGTKLTKLIKVLLPLLAAVAVIAVAIGAVIASNGDAHVPQAQATTKVETEAPTTTTSTGSECGLLNEVTIAVAEARTSTAPGEHGLGFVFHHGDEVECVERVDGLDGCWIEVNVPKWARQNYDPGTRHYLHLSETNSELAMDGPCSNAEAY